MGLMDMLQQIVTSATAPSGDQIDRAAGAADSETLRGGVTEALRGDSAQPLSQTLVDLFNSATPEQRAALLNLLTAKLAPGTLAGVAGGILAGHEGTATPPVPADKARQVTAEQVRDVAAAAASNEPGLLERLSGFYAEHPNLVKTLGSGAIMIALAHMKNSMKQK